MMPSLIGSGLSPAVVSETHCSINLKRQGSHTVQSGESFLCFPNGSGRGVMGLWHREKSIYKNGIIQTIGAMDSSRHISARKTAVFLFQAAFFKSLE